jgi:ATP-binding cassette subfamily F protein 3
MSLLSASNLSKSFGPVDIFSGISVGIPARARIGMVGPNGVGKTTLLRILAGADEPTEGAVQRSRGLRIGYLPQEASLNSERTLWQECLASFTNLITMQKELARLEASMSQPDQAEAALATYGRMQDEFERLGGYTYEVHIEQTLTGLGFDHDDFQRPVQQLSGGQRTRGYLARLLLDAPDLLMLDEPTNHLDIAAIEWLENYLKDWAGAVLLVSHDRYFLDQVTHTIWEMTPGGAPGSTPLELYRGNYSAYMQQREARYQRRLEEYEAQQAFFEKEEEYIRRNIAGQNTRQAQGRRKRLERMLEEARLTPPHTSRRLTLHIQSSGRSGDLVLRTYDLAVGYEDEGRPLFYAPDIVLTRGECAALIGPNGAGKTTFLKTILEQLPPYAGQTQLGASLQVGYFAQAHEDLNPELTLIQEVEEIAPQMLPGEIRDYLAKFLFSGDDVFKPVNVLSGGERGRLALARLALQGANLLLLDEPTNHLDLPSQEILQTILADFQGTILLVSHDRYLIDALATQVWEVVPDESALRVFDGTYSEYKAARQAEAAEQTEVQAIRRVEARKQSSAGASKNDLRRKQRRLAEVEANISKLEEKQAEIGRRLENPPADAGKVQQLGEEYNQVQKELESLLEEWGNLAEEIHQAG